MVLPHGSVQWPARLALAGLVAGCANALPIASGGGGPGAASGSAAATPRQVIAAAAAVFREHGIPTERVAHAEGIVESGSFTAGPLWDGEPVERRVDCGDAAGAPNARGAVVRLSVSVVASRAIGAVLPAAARDETTFTIRSEGEMDLMPGTRCRLTGAFAGRLADRIAALATGGR
jgi:hypothetical protein